MKLPQTLLLVVLALTTVGGLGLAWKQYQELVELRAQVMNKDERSDLQKRIWDLEKTNKDLADQLAAARPEGSLERMVADADQERADRGDGGRRGARGGFGGRGNPQQQMNALRELMAKPEVQAMLTSQQRAQIDATYAALFRSLNLSPEQAEKLKTLLAERSTTRQDVLEAARAQGINPRDNPEAFRKLIEDARNDVNNSIKATIGDAGLAQLQTYEQTLPQRSLVNALQQRLSYTDTPLTASQADQLVGILAANAPQRSSPAPDNAPPPGPGGRGGGFGGRGGGDMGGGFLMGALGGGPGGAAIAGMFDTARQIGAAPITSAAVSQSQAVLSAPQVAVLQQMEQQQQTQQQLAQVVRDTLASQQNAAPAAPTPGTPTGTTTGANGGRRRPGGK